MQKVLIVSIYIYIYIKRVYSKFLLIRDFNAKEFEPVLVQFLHDYNAVNIIHENTCYKNMKP